MSGDVRCFVAIELPETLRETMATEFAREGRGTAGVVWTAPRNLHLTLRFLGAVAADLLPAVHEAVAAALTDRAPFRLVLRGAGAFPPGQRPRVIWVGAGEGAAETIMLAAALGKALEPLGFPPESRAFTPHLTVGRVKAPVRDSAVLPRLMAAMSDRVWGEWVVPAVHLVRSDLFPTGSIYSILQTTSLPGTPRQLR